MIRKTKQCVKSAPRCLSRIESHGDEEGEEVAETITHHASQILLAR